MSDQTNSHNNTSGGSPVLAFIVGALVVAVGILGYLYWDESQSDDLTISIEGAGGAAESVGSAVEGAANALEGAADELAN